MYSSDSPRSARAAGGCVYVTDRAAHPSAQAAAITKIRCMFAARSIWANPICSLVTKKNKP